VIGQGEIWWAELPTPVGSSPGYRRPIIVVQADSVNASRISTVICIPLTGNLRWSSVPTSQLMKASSTGLPQDSVANVTQILSVSKDQLIERVGRISERQLGQLFAKLDVVLGRN
jgi:mRNA interferase MazF